MCAEFARQWATHYYFSSYLSTRGLRVSQLCQLLQVVSTYFSRKMIRLILLLAPASCILAGIAVDFLITSPPTPLGPYSMNMPRGLWWS